MGICIQATRFARVCYEDSMKYAHKRKTFGKLLIDHPVIRNKLAHMARKIEATHAWMEALIYQTVQMPVDMQMIKLGGIFQVLLILFVAYFRSYCFIESSINSNYGVLR
jgi:alkylation response protein AidB-like acyl-CoA dehydrogenase